MSTSSTAASPFAGSTAFHWMNRAEGDSTRASLLRSTRAQGDQLRSGLSTLPLRVKNWKLPEPRTCARPQREKFFASNTSLSNVPSEVAVGLKRKTLPRLLDVA